MQRNQLQLYRQPAVLAAVETPNGVEPLDPASVTRFDAMGSFYGGYQLTGDAMPRVKLTPNRPQVCAAAVTYLEREDDRWRADLHYHVDIESGLVDLLQFEIPPQWSEPFRVEPPMRTKLVALPGEQRRHLILYPDKPLSGQQVVKVTGRVAPSPGDRLSVPDIVPLEVNELERFIVLPRFLQLQQVDWDTLRLSLAELPARLGTQHSKLDSMYVYQVAGEHFQASLKAVRRGSAVATVNLADIHLVWLADGGYLAVAAFDVEPGGTTDCVLQLPAGCTLVHASVEQLPARADQSGRAPLATESRTRATAAEDRDPLRRQHAGPRRQSAARSPPTRRPGRRQHAVDDLCRPAVRLSRAPRFPVVVEPRRTAAHAAQECRFARRTAGRGGRRTLARGNRPLVRILAQAGYWAGRPRLDRDLIAARRHTGQSEESIEARQLDERMGAMDARLGATRVRLREPLVADATLQLAGTVDTSMPPLHYAVREAPGTLNLRSGPAVADHSILRWLAAILVLLLSGVAAWWMRSHPLPTFGPWAVTACAAAAWWLLLAPSLLGLIVLLAAAGVGLWYRWPQGVHSPN